MRGHRADRRRNDFRRLLRRLAGLSLLAGAVGAPAGGVPIEMDPALQRTIDAPSIELARGETRILRPGDILFRSAIRTSDRIVLLQALSFGDADASYSIAPGARLFLSNADMTAFEAGTIVYCIFPPAAERNPQLQDLLTRLAPSARRSWTSIQSICLHDLGGNGRIERISVSAVQNRRGRILVPERVFDVDIPSAILSNADAREAGRFEITYETGLLGAPELRFSLWEGDRRVRFDRARLYAGANFTEARPALAIDARALPASFAIGSGLLRVTAFDRSSRAITITADQAIRFTAYWTRTSTTISIYVALP
jgi:hypothetical protein